MILLRELDVKLCTITNTHRYTTVVHNHKPASPTGTHTI